MSKIDLNLLRVFDALFELRSVTRAAGRLSLTQSAVSHALGRLRRAMDDPLFVRHPGGLQPTAHAIEIAPGISEGLVQLRQALAPAPFDPGQANRRFKISAGAYFSALLVPDLMARARHLAPHVSFTILSPGPDLLPSLDAGMIDVALGGFGRVPSRLIVQPLFSEDLVWIANIGHPLTRSPGSISRVPARQRLEIAIGTPFPGHGHYSWDAGIERRVVAAPVSDVGMSDDDQDSPVRVYDPLTAISTVAETDLVALVPRRLALKGVRGNRIAILQTTEEPVHIDLAMLWHSRLGGDAGLIWLRQLIQRCLNERAAEENAADQPQQVMRAAAS